MKVTGGWGEEQINCRNQSSRVTVMAPMKCNGLITALGPGGTWYDGKGTYYDDDGDDSVYKISWDWLKASVISATMIRRG